jgi:hypothetical protein
MNGLYRLTELIYKAFLIVICLFKSEVDAKGVSEVSVASFDVRRLPFH